MITLNALVYRNMKIFFKDKGVFFTSLITPIILLVLYVTFLGNVYKSSFLSAFGENIEVSEKLINGFVGGELFSSLLAVCCITVSFCSNMIMVTDKITGARKDLTISPVKHSVLALSYYIATFITTYIICVIAALAGFLYLGKVGWYLSAADALFIFIDIFLLVMFGTALSSIINFFLSSQGQISAVGTIVSAGYGFICGAYMPISNFSDGLQKALSFLPGTYGTSLLRNHSLNGVFEEMKALGYNKELISALKDAVDCNIYFFENSVKLSSMFTILIITDIVLIAVYVLINRLFGKKVK